MQRKAAFFAAAFASCTIPALAVQKVDCDKGQAIGNIAAGKGAITLVVKGNCLDNIVIAADDVTITTDGVSAAAIAARDAAQPAILLDGARRVRIDGLFAGGLAITGGTSGISARRGSSLDLANCTVSGSSQNAVVASFASTVSIDHCTIGPNDGNGAVAANAGALVITDSTVANNAGQGIVATRGSYVRIGQDLDGTPSVRPVTVSASGGTGIAITESSSGNVVGGSIDASAGENLFVGRASSGQIGLGANGLVGSVAIRNAASHGVHVEGANATIAYAAVTGSHVNGIVVNNGASARIGLLNGGTYGSVTITGSGQSGIHEGNGGAVFLGGTTITGNGTTPGGGYGGFGISVAQGASLDMAGNNVVSGNAESGISVSKNAVAYIGDPLFGLGTTNTVSANGAVGPENGGIEVRAGATATIRDAAIADNTGPAIQAFDSATVDLRGSTSVKALDHGASTAGAVVRRSSLLSLRDGASIVSATGDGIDVGELAQLAIRDANVVQGNGANGRGIACFHTAPMTAPAAAVVGDLANVSGTLGSMDDCNVFP